MPLSKARDRERKRLIRLEKAILSPQELKAIQSMSREEAKKIVLAGFGRRPDLPSGKDFVDEVRGH